VTALIEGMLDSFTQRKNVTVNLNTRRRAQPLAQA
jgi:hypothetical protein